MVDATATNVTFTNNAFQENNIAINSGIVLDATNQFWGRNTGSSTDGGQGDPYTGVVTATPFLACPDACVTTFPNVDIDILGNGNPIPNGSTIISTAENTDFGNVIIGSPQTLIYTIENNAAGTLDLPFLDITGVNASDFFIFTTSFDVSGFNTTTFEITFDPSSVGIKNATAIIENTDCNNNPYTFNIQGTGISPCTDPDIPTITATTTICEGQSTTLSIATGNLNDATDWFWYSGSCGGTFVGNGTSITVSPTANTDYFVRGEGGCIIPAACQSQTITVNPLPTITFNPVADVCQNSGTVNLVATPAGGTFTGTNVTGNSFNPTTIGTFTITYDFTDGNGCTNSASQTITVNPTSPSPAITFNLLPEVCINSETINLVATPAGGTFSGTNVTGTTFNPTTIGTFTITYTYSTASGCGASTITRTQTIRVKPLPVLEFNLINQVCIDNGIINLTATPVGGTFSGVGVNGTTFNPVLAAAGTKTITYSFTENGCTNTISRDIEVFDLPVLTFENPIDVCVDDGIINLVATPTGGTFEGIGVNGTTFNPVLAGTGIFEITYSFTNQNGCTDSVSQNIEVFDLPVLTFENLIDVCINNGLVNLVATPTGGTFEGIGVNGTTFNPVLAGTGIFEITYSFTNQNGCTNSVSQNIEVFDLPALTFENPIDICINNGTINLVATPTGGTFEGIGVNGTTFNPVLAGAGIFEITYTFTNQNGCTNSVLQNIEVFELPTVEISSNSPICRDTTLVLNALSSSNIVEWNWRGANGFTSTLQNLIIENVGIENEGEYILTVRNQNGCQISDTLFVDILEGEVLNSNFLVSNEGCVGDTIYFVDVTILEGENIDFFWDFGDGTTSTERYPTHIYDEEGMYNIKINISSGECLNESISKMITIENCNSGRVEAIENTSISFFSLYPNPNNTGKATLELETIDTKPIQIEIIDVLGTIHFSNILQGQTTYSQTTNLLKNGIYIVYIKTQFGSFSKKLVIAF